MKPRRLPRIGAGTSTQNQNQNQDPNIITNNNISPKKKRNLDSIRKKNSGDPDYIKKYRRIRDRHQEDFAISLSPNQEDIISEDVRLYDNKDIHLETQKMKENMGFENTEYYIESIHHDQYYKINQIRKEEKKPEEILGETKVGLKKRRRSVHKKFTALEQAQALENKLYNKFDKELTDVITRTLSKVTIIFLFAQGLLAGLGLLHVILFLTYDDYEGLMFYDDNNYYCIYKTEYEKNYFSIRNMYSVVTIHNIMYVPTIMELNLSEAIVNRRRDDDNKDYTDIFFDYYTYDEIKEFYMRMSKDFYSIDEENKKIAVRGYDVRNHVYVDNCLTFDFNSKTITGVDSDGTTVDFN